jgi:hypothetical protein
LVCSSAIACSLSDDHRHAESRRLQPGDQVITTAVAGLVLTPVVDLDGLTAITLLVRFAPVSGGTTCKAWVQTSLDQGQTWADIFCAAFTTTAGFKIVNLSGLTPRTTVLAPTDAALADDTAVDGVLGDRLRLKITSTGTFGSGSVISARVACR